MTKTRFSFWCATLLVVIGVVAGCRQILGIEEATLICPPENPDCKLCHEPKDCGRVTECHGWACIDNSCVPTNKPARTACSTGVCSDDALSECVQCVAYEDCPNGQCRDHVCSRCDDGIKNGWEKDVDCGGGSPCTRCLGSPCENAAQCKSGFCTDGTCCDAACDEICSFCGWPYDGHCSSLPKYADDPSPLCDGMYVCDGFGTCLLRAGEICVSAIECASYRCEKSRCRKLAGESCFYPQECSDDLCVASKCQK